MTDKEYCVHALPDNAGEIKIAFDIPVEFKQSNNHKNRKLSRLIADAYLEDANIDLGLNSSYREYTEKGENDHEPGDVNHTLTEAQVIDLITGYGLIEKL